MKKAPAKPVGFGEILQLSPCVLPPAFSQGKAMSEQKGLVPKLRFPEFRDAPDWKSIALEQASTPVMERVGEKKLIPVSISAGIGFVPQAEKFGRDISGNQYQLYTLVSDGDFVFNKGNSLKFPQGCIYQLQGWGQVAAPNVFICFRLKKGYSDGFFQQCFEQNQHGRQLKRHITSGARSNGLLNISKETFFDIEILIPSLAEQQKIAECLSTLDELLAATSQKLDALKAHKKGLMEQLFPREGETLPRLRFPEFENTLTWEETTIGRFFDLEKKPEKANQFDRERIITVKLHAKGVVRNEKTGTLSGGSNYFKRRAGDFIFSKIDLLNGAFGIVPGELDGFYSSTDIPSVAFSQSVCAPFFIYWLTANYQHLRLERTGTSPTLKRVSLEKFFEIQIFMPEKAEQKRIASCLSSLDDLITAQSNQLEALKTHKKSLMQQLFPAPAEAGA